MEETFHATFSEDDEAISQFSTEGDAINFNKIRSFPDDEFNEPRTSDTLCNVKIEYFPYVPAFDRFSTINHVSQEPIITSSPLISSTSEESSIPNSKDVVQLLMRTDGQEINTLIWLTSLVNLLLPNQFKRNKVWTLVPKPYGKTIIGLKWVFKNKIDEEGVVTKNKAILVAKGYIQEEGINYDETFVPVKRLEAIRIFLAYASYMGFTVYQMDVKSAFLNGKISEEVYVEQPPGFESSEFPNHVCKLNKALYGLKQAPRAWYQANPKESNLVVVTRIFRYHKGTLNLGLCYPKGSSFDFKAYSDSDYAECNLDRKSTSEGRQILGGNICTALTKEPSAMYIEHLKDFWYTTEVDDATKDISFSLSLFENQLSFTRFDFLSDIGLTDSKTVMPLPSKGSIRAGLASLGLANKDKPSLTSTQLKKAEEQSLKFPSVEQLLDEVDNHNKVVQESSESPYDIESKIMVVKSFVTSQLHELQVKSMHASEATVDMQECSDSDIQSMPDDELSFLHSKLGDMDSSIAEINSSLPTFVTNALKEQLSDLLSDTLKDCLPSIIKDSLQTHILAFYEKFAETQTQLNKKKELSKVIRSEVTKKVQVVRLEGLREDLNSQIKRISKYSSSFQVIQTQSHEVKDLLKSETTENITNPEPTLKTQGELAFKESAMVLYDFKENLVDLAAEQEFDDDADLDKQPLSKRFKITHPIPKEPTPPRGKSKGKCIATDESPKDELVSFQVEGGFNLKMLNIKSFITPEGLFSQEKIDKQLKELKRLGDLKAQEEKSEEELKKLADPLPITKISYVVNSRKEETMKITKGNNPMNLIAKWLGLPLQPELAKFGLTAEEKKRKRVEFVKEVFVTEDVRVDGMGKNLIDPPGVIPIQGLVINEPESRIFFMNGNTDIEVMKGLSECKALESNVRRIQVKDIVKEVEDHLKTYSSAGIDIS
nr:retrovirus-related Pol polyprotein from transposon TNT 1-94 [Tanacetum cinerariifolium]